MYNEQELIVLNSNIASITNTLMGILVLGIVSVLLFLIVYIIFKIKEE